jgi:hypothetical protein
MHLRFWLSALLAAGSTLLSAASSITLAEDPVPATVETTLKTADRQIRQFVLDGDAESFFATEKAGADDHFSVVLNKPVALKSIAISTGKPDGTGKLTAGNVETSADGKEFEPLVSLSDETGEATADGRSRPVKVLRIEPAKEIEGGLAIREIKIESDPPVASFKYPVEVAVNVDDAPDMKDWAENVARICERAYPMINEELKSDGFKPEHYISMTLKTDYRGVAAASGNRIVGSVKFFKDHPDDVGAMVHETCHVVQRYRGRGNPGWLVEGVADYVRFFKFEPGKIGPLDTRRARYDRSYRVTAAFLAFLVEKYDKEIVLKLNKAMREGEYREELFKDFTGKTVQELDEEWRESLKG